MSNPANIHAQEFPSLNKLTHKCEVTEHMFKCLHPWNTAQIATGIPPLRWQYYLLPFS